MDEDVLDDVFIPVGAGGRDGSRTRRTSGRAYTLTDDEASRRSRCVSSTSWAARRHERGDGGSRECRTPPRRARRPSRARRRWQTLTASTTGIADANGLTTPNYTYQWIRVDGTDEADITVANSSTYTLIATWDDPQGAGDHGHTETLTSAATATVGAGDGPDV